MMTDDQERTTEALVERARRGERAAFEELVSRYGDRLERQIRARSGRRVAVSIGAEDVLQETLSRAWVAISRFRWQGEESFYRWLAGIAEHLIRSASQKKVLDTLQLTRDLAARDSTPSKMLRRHERFDRLERAIGKLTPDQRTALKLARIDGLPVREIAVQMTRSEKAVYALLSRALESLRETFGDTQSLHLPDRAFDSRELGDEA